MKTIILTLVTVFISTVNIMAQGSNEEVYSNINNNKNVIEKIRIDTDLKKPMDRKIYLNGESGRRVSMLHYIWNVNRGWICYSKRDYAYDLQDRLSEVSYVKWNDRRKMWEKKIEVVTYIYNDADKTVVTVNSERSNELLSEK